MSDLEIRQTRYGAPAARALLAAAHEDLVRRYGSGDENPVGASEFDPPEGCFLVAWRAGEPVACGGWRTLEPGLAEVKRMYAAPAVRGSGVASEVLTALEDSARERGMRRVVLETGGEQPEAIRFYEKCGYERIPNYGFYREEPDCVSFGRDL